MSVPISVVDAFTDTAFRGNPAAVCQLEAPASEPWMQSVAAEMNLAETAFVVPRDDREWDLRWFTPTVEVDLCGHATLAAAFVLMTEIEPARTEVTFRTRSGLLTVRRGEGGEFQLDFPSLPAAPADAETAARVARALGVEPIEVVRASSLFAVLGDAEAVRRVTPDFAAVAAFGTGVGVTAPGPGEQSPVDFVSRYFAPSHGIPEDPVTGSAHCTLTPYWAARLGKQTLRARQVSRRGGELSCALTRDRVLGDRVLIGGQARLVITGTLRY
jgi:PhzF family phenazine biosynthesis protein